MAPRTSVALDGTTTEYEFQRDQAWATEMASGPGTSNRKAKISPTSKMGMKLRFGL